MTKILIIRLSSIGDIVLTTPVIRNLKNQLGQDVELHYMVKENYRSIIDSNPHITKTWAVGDDLDDVIGKLVKVPFDYVIDLHNNVRSAKIKRRIKAQATTVNKLNVKKWIWINLGLDLMPKRHIVDRYMDTTSHLNVFNDGEGLDHFIPSSDEVKIESISSSLRSHEYIAWPIGATYKGKKFSTEKLIEVLQKVSHSVVLMGGKVDESTAEEILQHANENIFSAVGKYSLHQSASIVQQAKLVVTPDTGLMHIASAFKKDIISIWGCTSPGLGMYPYKAGNGSLIIEPENLNRRPCSKLGNRCKYKGGCINRISSDFLVEKINESFGMVF